MTEVGRWRDEALAEIGGLLHPVDDPDDVGAALGRVCVATVKLIGASGVGISLMAGQDSQGFAAASNNASRRLEELQFTVGEGPCVDAFSSGRPVLVADLSGGSRQRWPMYTPAAHDLGVRSVFAFPIHIGDSRLGALDVFRDETGALTAAEIGQSIALAEIALTLVLDGQQRAPVGATPHGFDHAPGFRAEIAQAQGMIMAQLGISSADALVRLRAYAYANARPVTDVARDVVARRLRFNDTAP